MRGGKVKFQSILMPLMEFDHPEKGDALYGELFLKFKPSLVDFHKGNVIFYYMLISVC